MKKRIFCLLLSLIMFACVISTGVLAVETSDFIVSYTYSKTDVEGGICSAAWNAVPDAWYYFCTLQNTFESGTFGDCIGVEAQSVSCFQELKAVFSDVFRLYGNGGDLYRVKVIAYDSSDNEIAVGYTESFESNFRRMGDPTKVKLTEEGIASCSEVQFASFYDFTLYLIESDTKAVAVKTVRSNTNSYDFDSFMAPRFDYKVGISAYASKHRSSKQVMSSAVYVKVDNLNDKSEVVSGEKFTDTTLSWKQYFCANQYEVTFWKYGYQGGMRVYSAKTVLFTSDTSVDLRKFISYYGDGEYGCTIHAYFDDFQLTEKGTGPIKNFGDIDTKLRTASLKSIGYKIGGNISSAAPTTTDSRFKISGCEWLKDGFKMTGTFQANTAYTLRIYLTAESGYKFTTVDETFLTVDYALLDGKAAKTVTALGVGNEKGDIQIDFEMEKLYNTISAVDTSCSGYALNAPVSGAKPVVTTPGVGIASYQWYEDGLTKNNGNFTYAKRYTVKIKYKADDAYRFGTFDEEALTLGGKTALSFTLDKNKTTLEVTYELSPFNSTITAIEANCPNYTIGGKIGDATPIFSTPGIEIRSCTWKKGEASASSINIFAKEATYSVHIEITAKYGYKFGVLQSANVHLAGATLTSLYRVNDEWYILEFKLEKLHEISEFTVSCDEFIIGGDISRAVPKAGVTGVSRNKYAWYCNGSKVTNGTFQAGKAYSLEVEYLANANYEFDEPDVQFVSVNPAKRPTTVTTNEKKKYVAKFDFNALTSEVTQINIYCDGYKIGGDVAKAIPATNTKGVYIDSYSWICSSSYVKSGQFKEGLAYTLSIHLKAAEGYSLSKYTCNAVVFVGDDSYESGYTGAGSGGVIETMFWLPKLEDNSGKTVSGTVTSYGSDEQTVTVELYKDGAETASYALTVYGKNASYSFDKVEQGTYTMKVVKTKHYTREYTVTIGSADVTQNAAIRLYGDVSGDGKVNNTDATQIKRYFDGLSNVISASADNAYLENVADVSGDGKINNTDATQIKRYFGGLSSVFDKLA